MRTAWGDDPDTEVIANFLYGLWVYDFARFLQVIERGARFVREQQDDGGSWQSTWYPGPYYGTYVCVRLLAELGNDDPLDRAREFLLASQRSNGGWGFGSHADQLSTAMALCALATIVARRGQRQNDDRIHQAVEMLAGTTTGGRWDSPTFIHMNGGRAHGRDGPWLRYGSSALTAAYVLKAAAAVQKATIFRTT